MGAAEGECREAGGHTFGAEESGEPRRQGRAERRVYFLTLCDVVRAPQIDDVTEGMRYYTATEAGKTMQKRSPQFARAAKSTPPSTKLLPSVGCSVARIVTPAAHGTPKLATKASPTLGECLSTFIAVASSGLSCARRGGGRTATC